MIVAAARVHNRHLPGIPMDRDRTADRLGDARCARNGPDTAPTVTGPRDSDVRPRGASNTPGPEPQA